MLCYVRSHRGFLKNINGKTKYKKGKRGEKMYKHGTYTQRDVPPSDGANGGDLFAKQSHQRMRHPQLRPSVTSKSGD